VVLLLTFLLAKTVTWTSRLFGPEATGLHRADQQYCFSPEVFVEG
jgi:hypothetical protein